jgi:hypothetical protein
MGARRCGSAFGLRRTALDVGIRLTVNGARHKKRTVEPGKSEPQNRRIMNRSLRRAQAERNVEGWFRFRLGASLFELGASPFGLRPHKTTPQVAFGYDPTGRSVYFIKQRTAQGMGQSV